MLSVPWGLGAKTFCNGPSLWFCLARRSVRPLLPWLQCTSNSERNSGIQALEAPSTRNRKSPPQEKATGEHSEQFLGRYAKRLLNIVETLGQMWRPPPKPETPFWQGCCGVKAIWKMLEVWCVCCSGFLSHRKTSTPDPLNEPKAAKAQQDGLLGASGAGRVCIADAQGGWVGVGCGGRGGLVYSSRGLGCFPLR